MGLGSSGSVASENPASHFGSTTRSGTDKGAWLVTAENSGLPASTGSGTHAPVPGDGGPGLPYGALFAGIFVVAFGTLLFEIALIRVFSFTIWHHFGYLVISTALLGFGASGSFLAVRPDFGATSLGSALASCVLLSGLTMVGVLGFVSLVPLHPMSILADFRQLALLLAYQLVTAIPFFFSGLAVSLALRAAATRVDRLYFWDLLGGGLGCLCAVGLMNLLTPPGAVVVAAAVLTAAAVPFAQRAVHRRVGVALAVLLLAGAWFAERLPFTPARTKEYSVQVEKLGAEPVTREWTALFRTDLVKAGPRPSRRWVPGLSNVAPPDLAWPAYFLSHDGTAGAGLFDLRGGYELDFVAHHVLQFPYLIANPDPRVLVIGVGGGKDIIVAAQMGASHVTGVELDPVALRFILDDLNSVGAGFFHQPHIELLASEGRHFIHSSPRKYDVIQLTGVDTLSAINNGAYVLAENYLYTVQAVHDYLDHLTPGGILSFAMGSVDPDEPRSAGRLVSVARRALRERGIERPDRHVAVIHSGALAAEVMIKTTPYDAREVRALAARARRLRMQPLLLPGREGHPVFEGLISKTGAEREEFLSNLRFRVDATSDDNPFFLSFFRWGDLFAPGRLTPSHVTALGQIVLGVLLISLTVLGGILILVPLVVFRRRGIAGSVGQRLGVMGFFMALGLGFMLFEISLIQRFVLFLGYPTYSLSVTLCSLLVFLGWGSYLSRRFVGRERVALPGAVVAIAVLAFFYVEGLPVVQGWFFESPLALRVVLTALMLAPLGLAMGLFFPLGIRTASSIHEDLVPWAWGINGCASVTAGVLAVVLAMSHGFGFVWKLSVVVYAVGTAVFLLATRSVPLSPASES